MTEPLSVPMPPKFVRCPGCEQRLGVREEDVGRKARCAKCGLVFVIEGVAKTSAAADLRQAELAKTQTSSAPDRGADETAPRPALDEGPATVTFECSLCQTRITMSTANVGKMVACPDCGRKNVIPPPPKVKVVQAPAAMSGEQFGVWGVDVKTWEAGAVAAAPALHPVVCDLCQTRMYATEAQLGSALVCPDCGTKTVAKRSKPQKPSGVLPAPAGQEYQLDPTSAPAPRPVPAPIAIAEALEHAKARALTTSVDGKLVKGVEAHLRERPVRPAVPLVTGVWPMLVTTEILARWVLLSIVFGAAAWCLHDSLMSPSGGMGGFFGIALMVGTVMFTSLWVTMAAPVFLAMIAESSDGNDKLHDPPQWTAFDWFADSAYLVNAGVLSGLMSLLAWRGMALLPPGAVPVGVAAAVAAAAWLLFFPVLLLGAMLENSAFGVISPRLLRTLVRCPGAWLLFYVETGVVAALAAGMAIGVIAWSPLGVFALPPIAMGAALVYMRLLGRLAWWLSEATAMPDAEREEDDTAAAHPHLAAARRAEREAKAERN